MAELPYDPVAADIARVINEIEQLMKARAWEFKRSRSPKSRTRYITGMKGKRTLRVRVSDHAPNPRTRYDVTIDPRFYRRSKMISLLDKGRRGRSKTAMIRRPLSRRRRKRR